MSLRIPIWYRAAGCATGRFLELLSSPRTGPWPPAESDTVWIHAASLGEIKGMANLLAALDKNRPQPLTLTSTTWPGVVRLRSLGYDAFLLPFDESRTIRRFLDIRKVRKAVFLEAEAWPAALDGLARKGSPVAFAGFRSQPSSIRRWRWFGSAFRGWTEIVHTVWTDSPDAVEAAASLGFARVRAGTSLKRTGPLPDARRGEGPDAAISLHLHDLPALSRLVREHSDHGWLWFPRHPGRAWIFRLGARVLGLTPVSRPCPGPREVYVSPRLGEVASLIPGCRSAWVSPGHDVSEPFRSGIPIVKTGNPPVLVDPPSIDPEPTLREVVQWID